MVDKGAISADDVTPTRKGPVVNAWSKLMHEMEKTHAAEVKALKML